MNACVLLFVQHGEGPVKYVGRAGVHNRAALEQVPGALTPAMRREYNRCSRWWLVECENAEAGREIIMLRHNGAIAKNDDPAKIIGPIAGLGRIIDSGVNAAVAK